MLGKPEYGWTDFHLEGTGTYGLSYLDDIPLEWLEAAIRGMETLEPFCVKGFLEPGRFLCMVSYWNCHVVIEDEWNRPLSKRDTVQEFSHTSMLEFCKLLHRDISEHLEEWSRFQSCSEKNPDEKELLQDRLDRLEKLIDKKESWFGPDRCFL